MRILIFEEIKVYVYVKNVFTRRLTPFIYNTVDIRFTFI